MGLTQDQFGNLSDSIQACGVVFRLRPSYVSVVNGPVEAGFELELRGLHDCEFEHVLTGCVACRDLLFTLLDIADCIEGEAVNGAEPQCRHVARYSHIFRECPETILSIKIASLTTLDDIADGWISRYADRVTAALRELGCREFRWSSEARDEDLWEASAELGYVPAKPPAAVARRLV